MNYFSDILKADLDGIAKTPFIPWDRYAGKTILVTGAGGLIGANLVNALIHANAVMDLKIRILAGVRDRSRAAARLIAPEMVTFIEGDITDIRTAVPAGQIDYIVHGANPTDSLYFKEHPVGMLHVSIEGTRQVMALAGERNISGLVFLSSMEVYGFPQKGHAVRETEVGGFDPAVPRNSYPISKQAAEALVCGYAHEYGLPARVLRLTQTFGPGVSYDDRRIFAEMMRCVIESKDITLHSKGETERSYLYTADAVTAVLKLLAEGEAGQAYTAAEPESYCSIAEMARLVADQVAGGRISVRYETDSVDRGYADTLYMKLDVSKLKSLGWYPKTGLKDMFERMIMDAQQRMTMTE